MREYQSELNGECIDAKLCYMLWVSYTFGSVLVRSSQRALNWKWESMNAVVAYIGMKHQSKKVHIKQACTFVQLKWSILVSTMVPKCQNYIFQILWNELKQCNYSCSMC